MNAKMFVALALAMASSAATAATVHPLNNKSQEHSQWCWDATARNLIYQLSGGSKDIPECRLADYAHLAPKNLLYTYGSSCNFPNFSFNTRQGTLQDVANQPNLMTGYNRGLYGMSYGTATIIGLFTGWNATYSNPNGPLSFSTVKSQIDANKSSEIALMFYDASGKTVGGHNVLLIGYSVMGSTNYVQVFDPEPGEGTKLVAYSALVSEPFNSFFSSVPGSSQMQGVAAKWQGSLLMQ